MAVLRSFVEGSFVVLSIPGPVFGLEICASGDRYQGHPPVNQPRGRLAPHR